MLNAFAVSGLLIVAGSSFMAVLMLMQGRKKLSLIWGVVSISVATWGLGVFGIATADGADSALWWWRIAYIGVIFIPILFTHFVHAFLEVRKRWFTAALYILGAFYLTADIFTDFFIREVHQVFDQFYYLVPTPLYSSFVILFFLLVVYSHARLYLAYRTAEGDQRLRTIYMFVGPLIGFAGGSFSFLPVYGVSLYPYLNSAVFVSPIIVGYAIVKHRLLDIRVVATQLFVIFLWVFIFTRVLLSPLGSQEQLINGTLLLLTVGVGILLVRSVMKEVRQREAIEKLNQELQALLNVKNEFLQIASHQLRTPVSVMRGMLDMLRERRESLTPEQRGEMIERAYLKSDKLNRVINDVLSATEMDVPRFDISGTARPLDLRELAQRAVESHEDEAADKGLALTLQAPAHVPKVSASETYLPQAMTNLIDNAIRYTEEGSVTVQVYPEGSMVVFAVRDTGIGVPDEDLQNLWTKFKRAANAKDMHTDGSGLGLFIVKKIVEGHPDGKVFVESKLGKGSTFGFKLPMIQET